MKTSTKSEVAEAIEKINNDTKFFISLCCCLITILVTAGSIGVYNHFKISKETRELHSLQDEAAQIQNETLNLKKRIAGFNKKIDGVLNSKEKYPIGEPIPEKINPCKILAEKETL